ncbi:uncharacterized protein LOC129756255 [Uranotaenia lowii]|uniref:uncharacterized protein LOC129756255 n=1 Tax=Uranotaenia lowii TaxID=190385 RepID=UPI00247A3014|nr:uncharacterized protein LOC129756255 [Uranotaenia lowii]
MEDLDRKRQFLQTDLVTKICSSNDELLNVQVEETDLQMQGHFDGFMSSIFELKVAIKRSNNGEKELLKLLVKVMKGDEKFRRESLSLILFPNEINVYKNVIPLFRALIEKSKASINFRTWCPRIYYADQGNFPNYSDQLETILVMQNVQELGYTSGPKLDLDSQHLTLMARKIAQFHACSYALRILDEVKWSQLIETIIPLNFIENGKIVFESYDIIFKATQTRIYRYYDANPSIFTSDKERSDVKTIREKYGSNPSELMQRCLQQDKTFSVILHGDYNRNNVLFKYEEGKATDVMMIDFQENRYGSPALDLSFFMYMNMTTETRNQCWEDVLKAYHTELLRCLQELTNLPTDDIRLQPYSFNNLMAHLSRYFIYGAMIAIKFQPAMLASTNEISAITHYFHNDIHAPEFSELLIRAGGVTATHRIAEIMLHCSKMGYLQFLHE